MLGEGEDDDEESDFLTYKLGSGDSDGSESDSNGSESDGMTRYIFHSYLLNFILIFFSFFFFRLLTCSLQKRRCLPNVTLGITIISKDDEP